MSWAYEAVKVGFSWPAFLIGPLWALAKGFWGYAGLLAVAAVLSEFLGQWSEVQFTTSALRISFFAWAAYMALLLVVAFNGNRWRAAKIANEDCVLLGEVRARSPAAAIGELRDVGDPQA